MSTEIIKSVAKVNNVSILIVDGKEKFVPIKPICEALGIDESSQRQKIKEDEILGSTAVLSTAVGSDGKTREMFSIPYRFVFGWLFTINPKNVNPEAREIVSMYRRECYEVLFSTFSEQSEFLEQKQVAVEKQATVLDQVRSDFKNAKKKLEEETKKFNEVRKLTIDEWKFNNRQLSLEFPIEE